ncbi:MAG: hypothetical protein JJE13_01610 [Thermoleophilia bacterium]|nr:hypothetical protein [Thermoleophilia bacterium]
MKDGAERNRPVLIRITLLFAVLQAASVALELAGTSGFALSLGLSVLLGAAYSGMVATLICLSGPVESGGQLWTLVRPVLARLIWASLLVAVAILAGVVFLIVPGLILLTIWSVVIPAIVAENLSVFEGLGRSPELVRGNGWRVFAFMMLLGVAGAIVLLITLTVSAPLGDGILYSVVLQFLISCLLNPITALGPASLYNQLTMRPEDPPPEL